MYEDTCIQKVEAQNAILHSIFIYYLYMVERNGVVVKQFSYMCCLF